jgi:F-type H+-transporting ATPase subunit b
MELVLDSFESFVGVNFWTMIFAWINLLILYIVLRKLLFKPVKNMIDSRQKEIDDMYSEAQSSLDSAKLMEAEYESKLEGAKAESEEILRSAVRRAELREEEILKEANAKARRTLERADEQVELEIIRLRNSELVKLAKKEEQIRNRRRQYMYSLRTYERRGRELAASGLTLEMLEADYTDCDDND